MRKLTVQFQLRLPLDLKDWLKLQSERNGSSQNSEVIRSIRERMEKDQLI